jgi:2-polyprenyl-3-methyl-5-hydroxy-6-metoxy-1,4-benzoquinol methylase
LRRAGYGSLEMAWLNKTASDVTPRSGTLSGMYELSATAYDVIHAARGKDYVQEAAQVAGHIRRHNADAGSLLDVGCGTGCHLVAFARLGFDVAGVELSRALTDLARVRLPDIELQ